MNSVQNRLNLAHILYTSFKPYSTRLFGKVYKMNKIFSTYYGFGKSVIYNRVKKTCSFCTLRRKPLSVLAIIVYRIKKFLYTFCTLWIHSVHFGKAQNREITQAPWPCFDTFYLASPLFAGALTLWNDYNIKRQSINRHCFQGKGNGKCNVFPILWS
jgi:hypothetical protein